MKKTVIWTLVVIPVLLIAWTQIFAPMYWSRIDTSVTYILVPDVAPDPVLGPIVDCKYAGWTDRQPRKSCEKVETYLRYLAPENFK